MTGIATRRPRVLVALVPGSTWEHGRDVLTSDLAELSRSSMCSTSRKLNSARRTPAILVGTQDGSGVDLMDEFKQEDELGPWLIGSGDRARF